MKKMIISLGASEAEAWLHENTNIGHWCDDGLSLEEFKRHVGNEKYKELRENAMRSFDVDDSNYSDAFDSDFDFLKNMVEEYLGKYAGYGISPKNVQNILSTVTHY